MNCSSQTFIENIFAQKRNIQVKILSTNTQSYSRVIHYKHHYLWCFGCIGLKERNLKKTKKPRNIRKTENRSFIVGTPPPPPNVKRGGEGLILQSFELAIKYSHPSPYSTTTLYLL